ncbi:DEAD/DEAH box helicase [Neobacillus massiliamazoniensis]|uniref:DEAD/DEAH box helicase domain-containing protein n=1 Tax=Neobacillus massiliamazoniensis TaxID=1499688 RepID=A0A0U1NYW7_9BACI|nr:DEAD/DEAH box helicase [Neobacillus massiliamazoniensis]CRK83012.1 DEAD/DEAH box helicase domain-containing protein [Neobacillus massiliamazoniensis]
MDYTLNKVADRLQKRLVEYIETRYVISNDILQKKRHSLLETPGTLRTAPYIEATPVYELGSTYQEMNILASTKSLMNELAEYGIGVFPRPYVHQQTAMEAFLTDNKDLIVSTGTGSGKTESFLHPMLATLYEEAVTRPASFARRGVRALILYPMNALVSDQMTRLRKLMGDERVKSRFHVHGRNPQFGMYTSRTPYAGAPNKFKDKLQLQPILMHYLEVEKNNPDIAKQLKERGKWYAKDLQAFKDSKMPKTFRYTTSPNDAELLTRHEMHETPPDILVTNYSMLEYMLMRPIEHTIWQDTKDWLASDSANQFVLVLDEAHMYRGTSGAEVALLIRRLQARLGISRDRMKVILTSASLGKEGDTETPIRFAQQLTGAAESRKFKLITGKKETRPQGKTMTPDEASHWANIDYPLVAEWNKKYKDIVEHLQPIFEALKFDTLPADKNEFQEFVFKQLNGYGPVEQVIKKISGNATSVEELVETVCPKVYFPTAEKAISNLLLLANMAVKNGRVLLPARLHLFFRGLSGVFICMNPNCDNSGFLGKIYDAYREQCTCGSRVFELYTHMLCGAAFIKAFCEKDTNFPTYLWSEPGSDIVGEPLEEIHLLIEKPNDRALEGKTLKPLWINVKTGYIVDSPQQDTNFIRVYMSLERPKKNRKQKYYSSAKSFNTCPCCLKKSQYNIRDLRTKGDQPFGEIVREQFAIQPPVSGKEKLPNEGRKVLIFSDGRQKAARLARDIPLEMEKDVIRQLILQATTLKKGSIKIDNYLYNTLLYLLNENRVQILEGDERKSVQNDADYLKKEYDNDLDYIFEEALEPSKTLIKRIYQVIGNPGFSIYDTATGYVTLSAPILKRKYQKVEDYISKEDFETIVILFIKEMLADVSIFDAVLTPNDRKEILGQYRSEEDWSRNYGGLSRSLKKLIEHLAPGHVQEIIDELYSLCQMQNERYLLKKDPLIIKHALEETWYYCSDCREIHLRTANNLCVNCLSDNLKELTPNSEDFNALKGFWRSPIQEVLDNRRIKNIRVEEHTAQLSQKDVRHALATTEKYELGFQDIEMDKGMGVVDILSSTTTMEVGIDIGSLTAVSLRNMPPQRENYQQRAGRSGRRGSSLSTVITYAQDSPHDHYYFDNPKKMISGDTRDALIYINNKKIVQRHINALFIQTYFHKVVHTSLKHEKYTKINESLGFTVDFFEGEPPFNFESFDEWLSEQNYRKFKGIPGIYDIIPQDMVAEEDDPIRVKEMLIRETMDILLEKLRAKYEENIDSLKLADEDEAEEHVATRMFIEFLFNYGFLPSYAFPVDLTSFYIQKKENKEIVLEQQPQLQLNRALSEYAPGRMLVVNKKKYRVGGIFNPYLKNPFSDEVNHQLDEVVYCDRCHFTKLEHYTETRCPTCNAKLKRMPYMRPTGFSPEMGRELQDFDLEQDYSYTNDPQLPFTHSHESLEFSILYNGNIQYATKLNDELIIMNRGVQRQTGFNMCKDCGFIQPVYEGIEPPASHLKPFLTVGRDNECRGELLQVFLANRFNSDLLFIRLHLSKQLDVGDIKPWLNNSLTTIGEAFSLAAGRVLDIDAQELSVGHRFVRGEDNELYADIYVFDTLEGGAGYSLMAGEKMQDILEETLKVLNVCPNDCDSSCYKCLRHYNNQFKHKSLHRKLGYELLHYLMTNQIKSYDETDQQLWLSRIIETHQLFSGTISIPFNKQNNIVYIELFGQKIALKNNIIAMNNDDFLYFSPFEIQFDLPNVYLKVKGAKEESNQF